MTEMDELIKKIKELAPQGEIRCADAHQLVEKLNLDCSQVVKACDEAHIKICACQLGCFK